MVTKYYFIISSTFPVALLVRIFFCYLFAKNFYIPRMLKTMQISQRNERHTLVWIASAELFSRPEKLGFLRKKNLVVVLQNTQFFQDKVKSLWEGHKIWKEFLLFDVYLVNQLICQNKREICSNFCGLFRKAEL